MPIKQIQETRGMEWFSHQVNRIFYLNCYFKASQSDQECKIAFMQKKNLRLTEATNY